MYTWSVVKLMDNLRVICKEMYIYISDTAKLLKIASRYKRAVNGKINNIFET